MDLSCIVHYNLDCPFGDIVPLSENAHGKLLEAKQVRTNSLSFDQQHLKQCSTVPDSRNPAIHGIHWECYKKFTHILSKRKSSDKEETSESSSDKRPKRGNSTLVISDKTGVQLFPKYCFFCKQVKKKVKGNIQYSHKLTIPDAEKSIKEAARRKNDQALLIHIENENLLSREFQTHDFCRRNYTRDKDTENLRSREGNASVCCRGGFTD